MPYRVDAVSPAADAAERLINLGALDVEVTDGGRVAALLPDTVAADAARLALGAERVAITAVEGRDDGSVWVLTPQPVQIGRVRLVPVASSHRGTAQGHRGGTPGRRGVAPIPPTIRPAPPARQPRQHSNVAAPDTGAGAATGAWVDVILADSRAFGTGLHPTTVLCLELLQDLTAAGAPDPPHAMLDIGTGSGVLALAALRLGVPRAMAIDIDQEALDAAAVNARLNGLENRLVVQRGGPETVRAPFPLVIANVLAAPLIEMAPAVARALSAHGTLVLSGIAASLERDVVHAYVRFGLRPVSSAARAGWVALRMQTTW